MKAFVFDTETTGLLGSKLIPLDQQPEVIEFYGCVVNFTAKGYKVIKEVESLFKPSKPITLEITRITGINDDTVKGAPKFIDWAGKIKKEIESSKIVIAHNASFDRGMIDLEMKRLDMEVKWPRIICTVEQTVGIKGFRLNLSRLHEELFGEKFSGAHRAKEDVQALVRCCHALTQKGIL